MQAKTSAFQLLRRASSCVTFEPIEYSVTSISVTFCWTALRIGAEMKSVSSRIESFHEGSTAKGYGSAGIPWLILTLRSDSRRFISSASRLKGGTAIGKRIIELLWILSAACWALTNFERKRSCQFIV